MIQRSAGSEKALQPIRLVGKILIPAAKYRQLTRLCGMFHGEACPESDSNSSFFVPNNDVQSGNLRSDLFLLLHFGWSRDAIAVGHDDARLRRW